MCSISGFLKFGNNNINGNKIRDIMINGELRGRDSFGYITFSKFGNVQEYKYLNKVSDILSRDRDFILDNDIFLLLNNNRAEPTTEFIDNKKLSDVQPYHYGQTYIVHNGTIANDKDLISEYNLKLSTKIDSAVIAPIFDQSDFSTETILEILRDKLIGSYALAVYSEKHQKLILATNYKPLSILFDKNDDVLYFSSLEDYLVSNQYDRIFSDENFIEIKPYTCLILDVNSRNIEQHDLYRNVDRKRALICASSGLDSTVAATWAKTQGYDITLLHFDYNCRAHEKEKKSIEQIAKYFDCELVTIKADFFKNVLGGSKLYDGTEITKQDEKGAELAIEWVPARNLIFMSIAAGYCEAKGIDYIVLGGNLEEAGCLLNREENLIRMFDGNFKMPAEVEVGDVLMSWNFSTNKFEPTEVLHKFTPKKDFYYEIVCDGRQFKNRKPEEVRFFASNEHPFWVKDKGWLEVKDLEPGMLFLQYTNRKQKVLQSDPKTNNGLKIREIIVHHEPVETYNFHCEPNNNFFVGKSGVLTHNSYPDNELIFQKKFGELLPNSLNLQNRVQVLTPVANLMKREIVQLGLSINAPLHLTWSCYENGAIHCGKCGPCFMRKTAFKMLNVPEVIDYAE